MRTCGSQYRTMGINWLMWPICVVTNKEPSVRPLLLPGQ